VGNAVAVNPDNVLEVHAKAAGWPVLDFKKRELKANRSEYREALRIKKVKR